jgi:hypothetical protein
MVPKLVEKCCSFHGTRRFISMSMGARHLSLSSARWIQSISLHWITLSSMSVLSSPIRLGLPSGLFQMGFATKILYVFLLSPIRNTCLTYLNLFTLISQISIPWSSSLHRLLQTPVTFSLLGSNIFPRTYSQTSSACVLPLTWEIKLRTHTKQHGKS